MRDGVFREHGHAEGDDELGDPVVDLGVQVIRTSRQDHALKAPGLDLPQSLLASGADLGLEGCLLGKAGFDGRIDFPLRHARPPELLEKPLLQTLRVVQGKKGIRDRGRPSRIPSTLFMMTSGYEVTMGQLKWLRASLSSRGL